MTKKGWKVVQVREGGFKSATWLGLITEYQIGETTNRDKKRGPFSVFRTRQQARDFKGGRTDLKILKVEYEESQERGFWYSLLGERHIDEGINGYPNGTRFADSVTPISVVR
jgi:hypothetical protein